MYLDYINDDFSRYQISTKNFLVSLSIMFFIYYFYIMCPFIRQNKKMSPEQRLLLLLVVSLPTFNDPFSVFTFFRKISAFFSVFGTVFVTQFFTLLLYTFLFLLHRVSEGPTHQSSFHRWFTILPFFVFGVLLMILYIMSFNEIDKDPSFQYFSLSAHSAGTLAIAALTSLMFFAYVVTVVVKFVLSIRQVRSLQPRHFYLLLINSLTFFVVLVFFVCGALIPYNTYGGLYLFLKGFITFYSMLITYCYLPVHDAAHDRLRQQEEGIELGNVGGTGEDGPQYLSSYKGGSTNKI
mmetsp:Transcript_168/g.120  ORF Transcript_168/g.120 Transcript_168/m.120 type:complete len:294 (+) Transcript_168:631-1512(+)